MFPQSYPDCELNYKSYNTFFDERPKKILIFETGLVHEDFVGCVDAKNPTKM